MKSLAKIRPMHVRDLFWVMQIEKVCFPSPWPKEEFIIEITKNRFSHYFVAICENKIVGFIGLWIIFEEAHITTIAVMPAYQKMGIGKSLLGFGEMLAKQSKCNRMILEVRVSNENAHQFYHNAGFNDNRIRKNYYTNNHEDAYEMIKEIDVHSGN